MFIATIILGVATWLWGLVVTWAMWGGWAVLVGLFFLGVGVVPMGMAAAAFNEEWGLLLNMGVTLTVLIVFRLFSSWLAEHSD